VGVCHVQDGMLNLQFGWSCLSLVEDKLLAEVTYHFIENSAEIFIEFEFIFNSNATSNATNIDSGPCLLSFKEIQESYSKMRNYLRYCHCLLLKAKNRWLSLRNIAILDCLDRIDNS